MIQDKESERSITMTYAFYITGEAVGGIFALALLTVTLVMLAVSGIHESLKLERSTENVRYRPSKQNSDL